MLKILPLYVKIIIGMVMGIIIGLLAIVFHWETFTIHWIKPWGTIFLNLLKLVAVPLVFFSLVNGVASLTDIRKLSRIGLKTISYFVFTTIIAIVIGLSLVNIIEPGAAFPEATRAELQKGYSEDIVDKEIIAEELREPGPLKIIENMVPDNIISAAGDNTRMLQVILFAVLFGVALTLLPAAKADPVKALFGGIYEVIMKIVGFIMNFAPYGVFALMCILVVEFVGDNINDALGLFAALGMYIMTVLTGIAIMILIIYPLFVRLLSPVRFKDFFKGIRPAQIVAFTTSSSAATLPVSMEQAKKKLGVSEQITNFVLPLGVTINMDGTALYQAVSAVFIAQAFGIELTLAAMLTIVFTATLSAIGTPGVPGGGIIMLIIVLSAAGIPAEGLALVLAVDRPLDMFRTVTNVTGDCAVAVIVAKGEGELNYPPSEK